MTLGERIREARELAGLSQAALAAKVGATMRSVGSWERDEYPPRAIARLEAVLGPLRADRVVTESPPLDRATDAQILTEIANRLAEVRRRMERTVTPTQSKPSAGRDNVRGTGRLHSGGDEGAREPAEGTARRAASSARAGRGKTADADVLRDADRQPG